MTSIFSADNKQWIYGDVFGICRLDLSKSTPKLTKNTSKLSVPAAPLSISRDGKLAFAAGRAHTSASSSPALIAFGLPALGLRLKDHTAQVAALTTTPSGDRVLTFGWDGTIEVHSISGDHLSPDRSLVFSAAVSSPTLSLGPISHAHPDAPTPNPLLCTTPDGAFAARTPHGELIAGTLGATSGDDVLWWRIPFSCDIIAPISLTFVGTDVWICVMEPATDTAHLCRINPGGERMMWTLPSLSPPAASATHLYYQPTSAEVRRRHLLTGDEDPFDVGHHNLHPQPDHGDDVYKGTLRPPPPTRLPGHLSVSTQRAFFVPWHAEVIVDLNTDAAFDRGLDPAPGAFRRLTLELLARDNQALRALGVQGNLTVFDVNTKNRCSPTERTLPWLPPRLVFAVASHMISDVASRFELQAGGWRWGSTSSPGGACGPEDSATLEDVHAALRWMIDADWLPIDADRPVVEMFERGFGRRGYVVSAFTEDAERLWLRAMLETIDSCGWPSASIPDTWATEPITAARACAALDGLKAWRRRVSYDSLQILCYALISHLKANAVAPLIKLAADFPVPLVWQQYRNVGDCLLMLCKQQPPLQGQIRAAWREINHPNNRDWAHDGARILEALSQDKPQ